MQTAMRQYATTIDYSDNEVWKARVRIIELPDSDTHNRFSLLLELYQVLLITKAVFKEQVLLLDASSGTLYPELLACVLIGLLPIRHQPIIALAGEMYNPNGGLRGKLERLLIRLADRAITRYIAWSSEELEVFPRLWKVSPAKMRHCRFFYTFSEADIAYPLPPAEDYIFAGGNAHRDYEPLLEVARRMPERRFVIATNRLNGRADLPPNVTAKAVAHEEYVHLMRSAAAVVIPIKQGLMRSAGQQTYLNAMALGKPTIINRVFGVGDLVEDGKTALVVDGSPAGYLRALDWVFDPANAAAVSHMCQDARGTVRNHFDYAHHLYSLLEILDEAYQERYGALVQNG
ncbi:MAG: glycosyltransferase [Chloroflexi bacterium]|nr:glycosyltransferase [Chloroflexota bacterium]